MIENHGEAKPRVIVAVSTAQAERSQKLGSAYHIDIPKDASLVVLDDYKPVKTPYLLDLIEQGLLHPGAVLVASPYMTGRYAPADEAELFFERENLQLVAELCKLLGATRVKTETSTLNIEEEETTLSGHVGKKIGRLVPYQGKVTGSLNDRQEWSRKLTLEDSYPGSPANLQAAQELISRHALKDPDITSLVSARSGENYLTKRTIRVTYDGTQDRNLKIAAEVALPQVSFGATFARRRHSLRRVTLDLLAEFPR